MAVPAGAVGTRVCGPYSLHEPHCSVGAGTLHKLVSPEGSAWLPDTPRFPKTLNREATLGEEHYLPFLGRSQDVNLSFKKKSLCPDLGGRSA